MQPVSRRLPPRFRGPWLVAAVLSSAPVVPAAAQDVEALGDRYGTRPPDGYFETWASDEDAFRFRHGRAARLRARMAGGRATPPGMARALGPREAPLTGTMRIPVILGLFSDSPDASAMRYGAGDVRNSFFGESDGTITDYYREVSGGRFTLLADVWDWTRASFTQAEATGGQSGLTRGTTGAFITQLLSRLPDVDWGQYDNDGPDGVPNSGDDDGFVDVLSVIHPTPGAECGGSERNDRIWSHRWSLRSSAGQAFTTTVAAADGGYIRIDDYVVQPIFACDGSSLSEIGVFTHELGHAFGLPDLYDTNENIDGKHAGAGNWDLMASGSWGCDGQSPESPCHMGAWSKAMLGWVEVETLPGGLDLGTLRLEPVETGGRVYRVDAQDGSGEYFLLENRARVGYDQHLPGEGLLIWQIDEDVVASRWRSNTVNAYAHMGVWLRQADGFNELGTPGGGRGDAEDPFPLESPGRENRAFHAASRPAATSAEGTATGLTLFDIQRAGQDVTFRLLTRFTTLTLRVDGAVVADMLRLNGTQLSGISHVWSSAPFEEHTVEAAAGEELEPGVRRPFRGWDDDPAAPRIRTLVTPLADAEYVARYDGRQVELHLEVTGGVNGVEPGTFRSQPPSEDLWFDEGATITVEAVPTLGFAFQAWTGALAGQPNPAQVTMAAPVSAGAAFVMTYGIAADSIRLHAATTVDQQLPVRDGTDPVVWLLLEGRLPEGLTLDPFGKLKGVALEAGRFPVRLRATDARGLQDEGEVVLDVKEPELELERLAAPFFGTGPALDPLQLDFLDRQGNANGQYDLGDLRVWILAHPELPVTAELNNLLGSGRVGR